jgi:hypothetical protein
MSKMHLDLKAIREKNKLSIQDIYEKTRLSEEMIRLIETGEIYNRPDANKTYLRSFSRTYAKAIGINDQDMVTALEYQEADMYEGFLAEKYLGEGRGVSDIKTEETPDSKKAAGESSVADKIKKPEGFRSGIPGGYGKEIDKENEKKSGAGSGKSQAPGSDSGSASGSGTGSVSGSDTGSGSETDAGGVTGPESRTGAGTYSESLKKAGMYKSPPGSRESGSDTYSSDNEGVGEVKRMSDKPRDDDSDDSYETVTTATASIFTPSIPESETVKGYSSTGEGTVNWADVNRKIVPDDRSNSILIILGIIGILLIAFLIYLFGGSGDSDTGQATVTGPQLEQPLGSDTLSAPLTPDTEQLAAALPDTLVLTIYAARGNLEPVRVLSDLYNLQRPFWIESGRAMRFEFIQEIQIRGNLERMILMYEDRVITDFQNIDPENRVIRISREQFLRDPTMNSFTTEEMPDNLPRPTEIMEPTGL